MILVPLSSFAAFFVVCMFMLCESGTLDRRELKRAFATHGAHFNYEDFQAFFKIIDDDDSGCVSICYFCQRSQ